MLQNFIATLKDKICKHIQGISLCIWSSRWGMGGGGGANSVRPQLGFRTELSCGPALLNSNDSISLCSTVSPGFRY